MRKNNKLGFTLVELLVVITILAIISIVAYQNFGGAVDKAVSGRKVGDISTIETALQQYKSDKNYYPTVDVYSGSTDVWGYNSGTGAIPSNMIKVTYDGEEIATLLTGSSVGGGKIYGSGTLGQIGAKGTISQTNLEKRYLSKDLYDPEIGDIKVKTPDKKMIDYGVGRYVYAVYRKSTGLDWGSTNKAGINYNIAFTIKKDGTDTFITKIVGDYDKESCYDNKDNCPDSLIGSLSGSLSNDYLINLQEMGKTRTGSPISSYKSTDYNQGIPYSVFDLAQ